jgi:hypothetical protein
MLLSRGRHRYTGKLPDACAQVAQDDDSMLMYYLVLLLCGAHRYTGKLPDASPEELLKMIRLADQYQVWHSGTAEVHHLVCLHRLLESDNNSDSWHWRCRWCA